MEYIPITGYFGGQPFYFRFVFSRSGIYCSFTIEY